MPSEGIQGDELAAYVPLDTYTRDERGIAYGTRVLWRRSPHSSRRRDDRPRRAGKPSTGRRGSPRKRARADSWHESAGQVPTRPGRGGTRDAERRDAPGDHPRPRQAKDPGHLPRLPCRHPRGASRAGARRGLRHRRAGCPETGPPGSEGGRRKRPARAGPRRRPTQPQPGGSAGSLLQSLSRCDQGDRAPRLAIPNQG